LFLFSFVCGSFGHCAGEKAAGKMKKKRQKDEKNRKREDGVAPKRFCQWTARGMSKGGKRS